MAFSYVTNLVSSQVSNLVFRAENLEKDIIDLDKTVKEKIIEWGNIIEQLIDSNYFDFPKNHISTYMRQKMRNAGKPDHFLDYLSRICPDTWKDASHDHSEDRFTSEATSSIYDQTEKQLLRHVPKDELKKMSNAEILHYAKKLTDFQKAQNLRARDAKNLLKEVLEEKKLKIPDKMYTSGYPPESYQGTSKLNIALQKFYDANHALNERIKRVNEDLIYRFPPSQEKDEEWASYVDTFREYYTIVLEKLLIPIDDEKWSDDYITWNDVMLSEFWHGKHAAAVLNAKETGEFEYKMVNGKITKIPLKRPYTREQVGDKIPELVDFMRSEFPLLSLHRAIHEWFTETQIKVPRKDLMEDLK